MNRSNIEFAQESSNHVFLRFLPIVSSIDYCCINPTTTTLISWKNNNNNKKKFNYCYICVPNVSSNFLTFFPFDLIFKTNFFSFFSFFFVWYIFQNGVHKNVSNHENWKELKMTKTNTQREIYIYEFTTRKTSMNPTILGLWGRYCSFALNLVLTFFPWFVLLHLITSLLVCLFVCFFFCFNILMIIIIIDKFFFL